MLSASLQAEKQRALDRTREIEDFTGRAISQSRRVYFFVVSAPEAHHIGKHEHLMVENTGAATLRYAPVLEDSSAIDWITAGASKTLDGDTDQFLPLSCTTLTTVLVTVW